jgi:hypothetical protein
METQTTQAVAPKSNNTMQIFCIGCAVLVICFLCCIISAVGILAATVGSSLSHLSNVEVVNQLCNSNETRLRTFYQDETTAKFKQTTSFQQFVDIFNANKNILGDCNKIKNLNISDLFSKGLSIDYSNNNGQERIVVTVKIEEKQLTMTLVTEDGKLKLDVLDIH